MVQSVTVYVDNMEAAFGRYVMCHLWADTREELFLMVDKIGVARKWFQRPNTVDLPGMPANWEHFDIAKSKRALAVQYGAVETDMYVMAYHANRQQFMATGSFRNLHMMMLAFNLLERRNHG